MRRMFRMALRHHGIDHRPAADFDWVDAGGNEVSRDRWLTVEGLQALARATRTPPNFGREKEPLPEFLARPLESAVSASTELPRANGSFEELPGRLKTFDAAVHAGPGRVIGPVEFQLSAFRQGKVREAYAARRARRRAALAGLLDRAARRLDLRLRTPAPDNIDALASLTRGLALHLAARGATGLSSPPSASRAPGSTSCAANCQHGVNIHRLRACVRHLEAVAATLFAR